MPSDSIPAGFNMFEAGNVDCPAVEAIAGHNFQVYADSRSNPKYLPSKRQDGMSGRTGFWMF